MCVSLFSLLFGFVGDAVDLLFELLVGAFEELYLLLALLLVHGPSLLLPLLDVVTLALGLVELSLQLPLLALQPRYLPLQHHTTALSYPPLTLSYIVNKRRPIRGVIAQSMCASFPIMRLVVRFRAPSN